MGSPLATMHKLLFLVSLASAAPQQRPFTSQDIQNNYQSPQQNYMENMYRDEVPVYREQEEAKIEKRQTAAYGPGPKYVEKEVPQPFQYEYGVKDDYSGNAFAKTETQNDLGQVQGSYKVNLPDGRVQTVTYNADHEGGFVAEVTYEKLNILLLPLGDTDHTRVQEPTLAPVHTPTDDSQGRDTLHLLLLLLLLLFVDK